MSQICRSAHAVKVIPLLADHVGYLDPPYWGLDRLDIWLSPSAELKHGWLAYLHCATDDQPSPDDKVAADDQVAPADQEW